MKVSYKKNVIYVTKGASLDETIAFVKKRIEKRQAEMSKREWIYKEYLSLQDKCNEDISWLDWLNKQSSENWFAKKGVLIVRFAVIDLLVVIFFESNDPIECFEIYDLWGSSFMRGVYDYEQGCYIERAYLIDLVCVTFYAE